MGEVGNGLGFRLETLQPGSALGAEALQSDKAVKAAVPCLPDQAHSATADEAQHLVAWDGGRRCRRGGERRIGRAAQGRRVGLSRET